MTAITDFLSQKKLAVVGVSRSKKNILDKGEKQLVG
jgi:hypothetical protein